MISLTLKELSMSRPRVLLVLTLTLVSFTASAAGEVKVTSAGGLLARSVAESLRAADLSPAASVHVVAAAGVITLQGHAATLLARERAAIVAEAVPGVRFVEVMLQVRPTRAVSDSDLRQRVESAVRGLSSVAGAERIEVNVAGGTVTLSGVVGSTPEKYQVVDAVRSIDGVRRVDDAVRVVPAEGGRRSELSFDQAYASRPLEPMAFEVSRGGRQVVIDGVTYDVVSTQRVEDFPGKPDGASATSRVYVVTPRSTP